MFWVPTFRLMFRTVVIALAAVALAFALFGAMMPGRGLAYYCSRHSVEMEEAITQTGVYTVQRDSSGLGRTVE